MHLESHKSETMLKISNYYSRIYSVDNYNDWKILKVEISKFVDEVEERLSSYTNGQNSEIIPSLVSNSMLKDQTYRLYRYLFKEAFQLYRDLNTHPTSKKLKKEYHKEYGIYNLPKKSNNYHGIK